MFAILVRYTAPISEIDLHLDKHRAWLREQYAAGLLLASGPQNPRVGGLILARAMDREKLDTLLANDPFKQAGVASYEIVEFTPVLTAPELEFLRES